MKIAFYSESPADQAALAVFTEGLLGEPPEPVTNLDLQGHGVAGVLGALDGVIRGLHYGYDADGLVVVVDCDDTELHDPAHETPDGGGERCRYCQIRKTITTVRKQLKRLPGRPELKVAIGLAVPAIEAWYLVGKEHQVGEAAWKVGLAAGQRPFTRPQLKKLVYGKDRPSLELMTSYAETEARRIIKDITALESHFPIGFGLMAQEIRSWKAPRPPQSATG